MNADPTNFAVFVDESCKPVRDRDTRKVTDERFYVAAAAICFTGDLNQIRAQLARIESAVGSKLHYKDLTPTRRLDALRRLTAIPNWEAYVFETAKPFPKAMNEHHVRAKIIEKTIVVMDNQVQPRLIKFESRSGHPDFKVLDQKDHDVLRRLQREAQVTTGLRIEHHGKSEMMFTIADLVAGACTDALCAVTSEPFALITHRVNQPVKVNLA